MRIKDQTTLEQEKEYWEKVDREAPLVAIAKCEEAAKQLITINSLTTTAYVSIISFSDILKHPLSMRPDLLFLVLPLPFWLTSLILATRVIVPRAYTVKQIRDDYVRISRVKYRFLQWGYVLLFISMLALIAVIVIYLLYVPTPPP